MKSHQVYIERLIEAEKVDQPKQEDIAAVIHNKLSAALVGVEKDLLENYIIQFLHNAVFVAELTYNANPNDPEALPDGVRVVFEASEDLIPFEPYFVKAGLSDLLDCLIISNKDQDKTREQIVRLLRAEADRIEQKTYNGLFSTKTDQPVFVEFRMKGEAKDTKEFNSLGEAQAFMNALKINPDCESYGIVKE